MKYARESLFYSVIVIFVITAVITLCGVADLITIKSGYLDVLFSALVIELVAAVIGLFKATDWFGKPDDLSPIRNVEGCWWQFIKYQRENAISFVQIKFDSDQQQLVLDGAAYDAKGNPYARWWSVGTSFNVASSELRYFWRGDHEIAENDFSGVGFFRFNEEINNTNPDQATGWFTSGNIDRLEITGKQKVELRRLSEKDMITMLSNDREAKGKLASSAYLIWNQN